MMWSYVLTAFGVAGLILAGRNKSLGWAIGLSAQVLWLAYAVATKQWGFIFSALVYGSVYFRNWRAWKKAETKMPQEVWELTEAIRLTQEYVGLPAIEGWSWYDALKKYRPELNLKSLHGESFL